MQLRVCLSALFLVVLCSAPLHGSISKKQVETCDPKLLARAHNGDVNMQSYVAFLYATGNEGVQQDFEKAYYWYKRIIDHDSADAKIVAHANLRMGLMYNTGNGVDLNHAKAMACFRKAAEQGYYDAHLAIGLLYAAGNGVKKDYDRALYWWRIAEENKHPKARTFIKLLERERANQTAALPRVSSAGSDNS